VEGYGLAAAWRAGHGLQWRWPLRGAAVSAGQRPGARRQITYRQHRRL